MKDNGTEWRWDENDKIKVNKGEEKKIKWILWKSIIEKSSEDLIRLITASLISLYAYTRGHSTDVKVSSIQGIRNISWIWNIRGSFLAFLSPTLSFFLPLSPSFTSSLSLSLSLSVSLNTTSTPQHSTPGKQTRPGANGEAVTGGTGRGKLPHGTPTRSPLAPGRVCLPGVECWGVEVVLVEANLRTLDGVDWEWTFGLASIWKTPIWSCSSTFRSRNLRTL